MPITAIALLRIPGDDVPVSSTVRVDALDDAVLLYTNASFAEEPAALSARVRALIGDVGSAHSDPRGVFYIPDVAAPKGRRYDDVIAEVGEGGVWGPSLTTGSMLPSGLEPGALNAMLEQIPSSLLDAVGDVMRRDPAALQQATLQLQALMGSSGPAGIGQMLNTAGIDLSAPNLQSLMATMQQELEADPTRLANLAEQLLSGHTTRNDDDDD